jgi:hypothetical protein
MVIKGFFGSINFMFTLADPLKQITTFFLVINKLNSDREYLQDWPHLNIHRVLELDEQTIISSEDIEGHCACYSCPDKALTLLVRLNLLVNDYFVL